MVTRLYLHAASSTVSGTLPAAEQSQKTSTADFESQATNRSMNTTIGTAQATLSLTRAVQNTGSDLNFYVSRFISDPLNQTSVAANTWTWNFSVKTSSNTITQDYPGNATNDRIPITCYIWRPSTGAKVGTILDGTGKDSTNSYWDVGSFSDNVSGGTLNQVAEHGTFAGSAVTCQVGDVLVIEAWVTINTNNATSVTNSFYYDGTTANTTNGATVSNHASFLETPETIAFGTGGGGGGGGAPGTKMQIKTGTFTSRTTTGTDVVTGVGFTPKVIILYSTAKGSADDTIAAHFAFRFGAAVDTTSANQRSFEHFVSDNSDPTATQTGWHNAVMSNADGSLVGVISAIGSDGFTVNWTAADGAASHVNWTCIGGSDITNVKSGIFTGPTATGNQATTGIGFKPDFVMFFGIDTTTDNFGVATDPTWGVGFASSSTSQAVIGGVSKDGQSTSNTKGYMRADNTACYYLNSSTTTTNKGLEGSLVSMDSGGWTINWTTVGLTSRLIGYVAIKGGSYKISAITSPTSGTTPVSQATTGFGFQPAGIMMFGRGKVASTAITADDKISVGAASSSTNVRCAYSGDLDAQGAAVTMREHRSAKIGMVENISATESSSTIAADAGVTSMDTDGYTLSWSTHDTTAYQFFTIGFGASPAVAQNITKSLTATVLTPSVGGRPTFINGTIRTLSRPITIVATQPTRLEGHVKSLSRPITIVAPAPTKIRGKVRTLARIITLVVTGPTRVKIKQRIPQEPPVRLVVNPPVLARAKTRTLTRPVTIVVTPARRTTKQRTLARIITTPGTLTRLIGKKRAVPPVTVSILAATLTKIKGKVKTLTRPILIVANQTKTVAKRKSAVLNATVTVVGNTVRFLGMRRTLSASILIVATTPTRLASRARIRTLSATVLVKSAVLSRLADKKRTLSGGILSFAFTPLRLKARTLNTLAQLVQITVSLPIRTPHRARIFSLTQSLFVSHLPVSELRNKRRILTQMLQISALRARLKERRLLSVTQNVVTSVQNVTFLRRWLRTLSQSIFVSSLNLASRSKKRANSAAVSAAQLASKKAGKVRAPDDEAILDTDSVDTDAIKAGERAIVKNLSAVIKITQIQRNRLRGIANKWRRIGS